MNLQPEFKLLLGCQVRQPTTIDDEERVEVIENEMFSIVTATPTFKKYKHRRRYQPVQRPSTELELPDKNTPQKYAERKPKNTQM